MRKRGSALPDRVRHSRIRSSRSEQVARLHGATSRSYERTSDTKNARAYTSNGGGGPEERQSAGAERPLRKVEIVEHDSSKEAWSVAPPSVVIALKC